jgi:hypothetical protein
VLEDARVYCNHANKKEIDADDIKLAVQIRMDNSFTSPPPRDVCLIKLTICFSVSDFQYFPLQWQRMLNKVLQRKLQQQTHLRRSYFAQLKPMVSANSNTKQI